MMKIEEGFWYDEDTYIEAGEYERVEDGYNGWPMIKVNGIWLDICE